MFIILHIIFSLLFTPLYIGFIFNMLGFVMHRKKNNSNYGIIEIFFNDRESIKYIFFFSLMKGLLFFPYIITFLPFIIILLLPSIFSKKYYFRFYTFYYSIIYEGGSDLAHQYFDD